MHKSLTGESTAVAIYFPVIPKSFFPKISDLPICCSPPFKLKVQDNEYDNILLFLWIILQKPESSVQLSQTSNSYLIFCLVCSSPLGQAGQEHMSMSSWKTTVGQRFRNFKIMIEQSNNSQRGEGRGQCREGFSGTTIKDTWKKPRGKVEAREGGGFGWGGGRSSGGKMPTTVIEQQ